MYTSPIKPGDTIKKTNGITFTACRATAKVQSAIVLETGEIQVFVREDRDKFIYGKDVIKIEGGE